MLSELAIRDREIKKDYIFDPDRQKKEIDYDKVFQIIEKKRKESTGYLMAAIGQDDKKVNYES